MTMTTTVSDQAAVDIAISWQDSGRGWALAALATGSWQPPLTAYQLKSLWEATETIEQDHDDYEAFTNWLVQQADQGDTTMMQDDYEEKDAAVTEAQEASAADQLRGQISRAVRDPFANGDVIRWTSAGKWTYVALKTNNGWFTTAGGGEGNYRVPGRCDYEELLEVLQRSDVSNVQTSTGWDIVL